MNQPKIGKAGEKEVVASMSKKSKPPRPSFPKPRAEFAGELMPGFYPGPITQGHGDRFFKDASKAPEVPAEDSGEK